MDCKWPKSCCWEPSQHLYSSNSEKFVFETQPQKETTRKEKCKGFEKEYPINDLMIWGTMWNTASYLNNSPSLMLNNMNFQTHLEKKILQTYITFRWMKVYKLHLMLHLICSCHRLPNKGVTGYHQLPLFLCSHQTELTGYMYHQMPLFQCSHQTLQNTQFSQMHLFLCSSQTLQNIGYQWWRQHSSSTTHLTIFLKADMKD